MLLLLVISVSVFVYSLSAKSFGGVKFGITSPTALTALFVATYCIIGVLWYWNGEYYFLGYEYGATLKYTYSVVATYLVIFFFCHVFVLRRVVVKPYQGPYLERQQGGLFINLYVFVVLMLVYIYSISWHEEAVSGALMFLMNSLVPVIAYYVTRKVKVFYLYMALFTIAAIYFGFRFRLILLYVPIILMFFYKSKFRWQNLFLVAIGAILFFVIVGIVGATRSYSSGINLEVLLNSDAFDIMVRGIFNDTSTVLVTGAFIDHINATEEYLGVDQIWYVAAYLLPAFLFQGKEYSPILEHVKLIVNDASSGAAVLGFAEFYHTAGFFGVIVFAAIYGIIFACLYKRYVISNSQYYSIVYFTMIGWLLNSYTRGYLPQNYADLFSLIVGLLLLRASFRRGSVMGTLV